MKFDKPLLNYHNSHLSYCWGRDIAREPNDLLFAHRAVLRLAGCAGAAGDWLAGGQGRAAVSRAAGLPIDTSLIPA